MSAPRSRAPRILHVLPADGTGGTEIAARLGIRDDGRVHVHFLERTGIAPLDEPNVTHGAATSSLSWQAMREAVAIARRVDPDVIVVSLWRSVLGFLALKRACPRARIVVFLHCDRPVSLADRLGNGLMMRLADRIWADSTETLERRAGAARAKRGRVISFITDKPRQLVLGAVGPHFIFWGRLHRHKGLDRAIALIAELRSRGVAASYTIVGPDDGEQRSLRELAAGLELDEAITFTGRVDRADLPQRAATATFYLQLSRLEGMAMAVVEAMQLGLVPVVTPVGGIQGYARDGENAIIHRDIRATADRLVTALEDPERLRAMRAAAVATFADAPHYAESIRAAAADTVSRRH